MATWPLPPGLPAGRYVTPLGADEPVLWITDEPLIDAGRRWGALHAARVSTGLWPLVLTCMDSEPHRPWHAGELDPATPSQVDAESVDKVLAQLWHALTDDAGYLTDEDCDWPNASVEFGLPASWPGLAAGSLVEIDPEALAARVAATVCQQGHLGLVPARRGADAVAMVGWDGSAGHLPAAQVAAVLRSWEERFGVRVVGLGFDTLELSVAAPPVSLQHARRVAAEHYAFCPDNIAHGPEDFELYAKHIRGTTTWSFWWD
jgi:hypothetical protein